jgi:hypothetical protein
MHHLLTTTYHMLKNGTTDTDLGADHFDRRPKDPKVKRRTTQFARMGLRVEITPLSAAACGPHQYRQPRTVKGYCARAGLRPRTTSPSFSSGEASLAWKCRFILSRMPLE